MNVTVTLVMKKLNLTNIKSLDIALTLSKDLMLCLVEKVEAGAAENQQKVIPSLEDAKFKLHVSKNSKQTT